MNVQIEIEHIPGEGYSRNACTLNLISSHLPYYRVHIVLNYQSQSTSTIDEEVVYQLE